MESNPLISIIIPAFNAQKFIVETLDSIFSQTYQNYEVIVVDDGSTDLTSQILRSYGSRIRYFYQENSGGCAIPRNVGIRQSLGEYLCFIDADDLMAPDYLATQAGFLDRNPDVGVVFCDYRNFNQNGSFQDSHFETCQMLWAQLKGSHELILKDACVVLSQENFGIAGSFMTRRYALNEVVGFEPSLKACEDFHFYFRLARLASTGIIHKVGMLRRIHGNNMSGNPEKMLTEGIRSRTLLREGESDAAIQRPLDRYIIRCHAGLARHYADTGKFFESLQNDWMILSRPLFWPEVRGACRNMLRTLLLAVGFRKKRC